MSSMPGGARVAVVTGSGRNIGRAIALELATQGADICVNVRKNRDEAEAVAEEVRRLGQRAVVSVADVCDSSQVKDMFTTTERSLGPVTIVVNNAAVRNEAPIEHLPFAEWQRILGIILDGAFLCAREAVPFMHATGWGRIVNVAGISGQAGASNACHVVAAKAGLIGFTKALAVELAPANITVNAVSPGLIETARRADSAAHHGGWRAPLGRRGTPVEAAAAVGFLASEAAGFITGQILSVNGGAYIP